jgi:MoxR-like ATPase
VHTRHRVDTSVRFDRTAAQPDSREIEVADVDPVPATDPPIAPVPREPYLAGQPLEDAVNLAIALGRPAHAVAYALGLPLEEVYIKSTSRAQELLYTYDAVRRLYDAQLPGAASYDARSYVRLGPLGRAIARSAHCRRSVVLIDEIDKADLDFPNDLLRELDRPAFEVAEAPELRYALPDDRPDLRPIIFVTNNEEKTLPGAFLRRCIFHYVEFPSDPDELDHILDLHGVHRPDLRSETIKTLLYLRELDLTKKPGLSELLDWVGYLQAVDAPADEVGRLPYQGALLKQRGDQVRAAGTLGQP